MSRLAAEGQEWRPGREYDILGPLGGGEGRMSVVFRIRLRPPRLANEFALKMVVHYVGETPGERAGHAQSTVLARGLGAEWREPLRLPPHESLVPVLHHYHSTRPRLRDHIQDPFLASAAADRTLFLVMPLYAGGSLRTMIAERRARPGNGYAAAPFGLGWLWFGQLLLRMLRAVEHLIANDLVHGDIKDDQFFLDGDHEEGKVVLGDFGSAWKLVDEDGVPLTLGSRNELPDRRAGVGRYKAPEVRGRTRADRHPPLREVYAKAEGFSVGVVMLDILGVLQDDDLLDRLCSTHLEVQRRLENGQPPSNPADPEYGNRQPGWIYTTADLPRMPAGCPDWLSEVVLGLLKSDHNEAERRLTPAEAIAMLEVPGVVRNWEAHQAAEQRLEQEHQLRVECETTIARKDAEINNHAEQLRTTQAEVEAAAALAAQERQQREEAEALVRQGQLQVQRERQRRAAVEAQNLQMHQEAMAAEQTAAAHTENEQRLRQRIEELEQKLVRIRLLQSF